MGVIREFGGSDKFDIGILGFYDFIWFLYLTFLFAKFSLFWLTYIRICVCIYSGLLFAYML